MIRTIGLGLFGVFGIASIFVFGGLALQRIEFTSSGVTLVGPIKRRSLQIQEVESVTRVGAWLTLLRLRGRFQRTPFFRFLFNPDELRAFDLQLSSLLPEHRSLSSTFARAIWELWRELLSSGQPGRTSGPDKSA